MKLIRCDRCAAEARRKDEHTFFNFVIGAMSVDLCPKCYFAFEKFMEGGKANEPDSENQA